MYQHTCYGCTVALLYVIRSCLFPFTKFTGVLKAKEAIRCRRCKCQASSLAKSRGPVLLVCWYSVAIGSPQEPTGHWGEGHSDRTHIMLNFIFIFIKKLNSELSSDRFPAVICSACRSSCVSCEIRGRVRKYNKGRNERTSRGTSKKGK